MYRTTLAPILTLRREMDRLFDDTFGRGNVGESAWRPTVDVREENDAYLFDVELPGVTPEQVEVTADGGVLTVRGEKAIERSEDGGGWHVVERLAGAFQRSFQLPANVLEDRIDARFSNGLLTVRVPKQEAPKPKRIEVKA
ncbi:MAG: Hsp20/alpha crystallin family protein [Gemmatimonadaceae bacterium]